MKLRIKGSSLRLRLTQPEVQQLAEQGEVNERVEFGPGVALTYRVARDKNYPDITARYADNLIEIRVPERQALEWCRTDLVTLSHSQEQPGAQLRIVVEKDWSCLQPREDEDESENFPHPDQGTGKAC